MPPASTTAVDRSADNRRGAVVKQAQQAHIDIERATYEDQLVREHLPLVQYVVSEVAHRVPSAT